MDVASESPDFLGITLADNLFFIALQRLGAGLWAVVECLYLPVVIFLSAIFSW
jgi:drug/metabolite transporter (DMT)-like permease